MTQALVRRPGPGPAASGGQDQAVPAAALAPGPEYDQRSRLRVTANGTMTKRTAEARAVKDTGRAAGTLAVPQPEARTNVETLTRSWAGGLWGLACPSRPCISMQFKTLFERKPRAVSESDSDTA